MLVVIIIGVLAALVMPRLVGRSEQARSAAARSDISSIGLAMDMYEMDIGSYPDSIAELRSNSANKTNWKGPYLKKDPKDPWGKDYNYKKPSEHGGDYDLYSSGPNGVAGDQDDIGNW
jgi:general secretion pathway protein G